MISKFEDGNTPELISSYCKKYLLTLNNLIMAFKYSTISTALLAVALFSPPRSQAAEPIPYLNVCDDLSTVTVIDDGTTNSKKWHIQNWPSTNNQIFRHQPNSTGTSAVSKATLWTKELDLQAGKTYEISVDIGVWTNRAQTKAIVALYSTPENNATTIKELGTISPVPQKTSTSITTHTYFITADANTPRYLCIANRGGGSYSWFMVDNISVKEADELTPVAATNLTAAVTDKNVAVSFTLPSKSVVNSTLTTINTVRLLRKGVVVKEWTNATAGSKLNYNDFVSVIGSYDYVVECANNGSFGPTVSTSVTIGPSTSEINPTTNSNYQLFKPGSTEIKFGRNYMATAVYSPGEGVKVSWQAYNAGEGIPVTYTVTRVQDNKVIAEKISELSVIDPDGLSAENKLYTYKIKALYEETEKDAYTSQTLSVHLPVPFLLTPSRESLLECSIIDGDNDMKTWSYINKSSDIYKYGASDMFTSKVGDDYLITPGVDLKLGKTYRIDVTAHSAELIPSTVGMALKAGKTNTMEAMDIELIPGEVFTHMKGRNYSAYYTPTESAQFFFGIRAYNPLDRDEWNDLGISAVNIVEVSSSVPVAVDEISVVFSAKAGDATLKFNAPAKDIVGNDLTALDRIEILKNGTLFKTISNPTPGEEQLVDITITLGQQDTYTTVPYTIGGPGLSTSTDVMIIEPPYENHFDSQDQLAGFTVLNPGQSGQKWSYQANTVRAYPDNEIGHNTYLITPPLHLEGGQFYRLDFLTWIDKIQQINTNEIEVLIGNAPTIEAMTRNITQPYTVKGNWQSKALSKEWFSVPETGEYYLAWHAKSTPDFADELYVDDITISDKIDPTYPGGVTDLKIQPDQTGELKATVSFKIPTVDLAGNELTNKIYQYQILRDGVNIKSEFNKDPGTEITYEDTQCTEGVHMYTVVCYGAYKKPSREVDAIAYVGINLPGPVSYVEATENPEKYGEVTIKWGNPETDINGFELNTSEITYTVGQYIVDLITQQGSEKIFQTGVTGNELTIMAKSDNDSQEFSRFFVRPATAKGDAKTTVLTRYMAVGKPYTLPFTESFKEYRPQSTMMSERTGDGSPAAWGFNSINPVTKVPPVDADNGLALMEVMFLDGGSRLFTGRIDLTATSPIISFWVYNQTNISKTDANILAIQVREGNGEFVDVERKSINEWADNRPGWQKAQVDLSDYVGKVVYIGFDGQSKGFVFIHMDAITVSEKPAVDLSVNAIDHENVYVGLDHTINVVVKNRGSEEAKNARLRLMRDGQEVDTRELDPIAAGAETTIAFTQCMNRDMLGTHYYSASVEIENDADLLDNSRIANSFNLKDNDFPVVENLAGQAVDNKVTLTWDNPDIPSEPTEITDDFEDYESWSTIATGIGDYTLIDGDEGPVGGFQDIELPNIPINSKQSFVIFDFSKEEFQNDTRYRAHSGDKALASFFNTDRTYTDDVLISPRLCGKEQTLKFWARGFSDQNRENFVVRYSTKTNALSDFEEEPLDRVHNLGGEWTEFTYTLPEGTRYFQIEHYSAGGYFLFLDDFTFTPEGNEILSQKGFNIYLNDVKVTETPITATTWDDLNPNEGDNTYGVSAVYDRGESPTTTINVAWTGLDTISGNCITIAVDGNDIVVTGAEGEIINVTAASGLTMTTQIADAETRIPVASGIYIVKAGSVVAKVAVR